MDRDRSQERMILKFLETHAPVMPVKEALWLAREFQRIFDESMRDAECLAILSESVLGYDSRLGFGERFKNQRPAVQLALKQVAYRHGWVVCGPVADAMEKLLHEYDERAKKEPTQ